MRREKAKVENLEIHAVYRNHSKVIYYLNIEHWTLNSKHLKLTCQKIEALLSMVISTVVCGTCIAVDETKMRRSPMNHQQRISVNSALLVTWVNYWLCLKRSFKVIHSFHVCNDGQCHFGTSVFDYHMNDHVENSSFINTNTVTEKLDAVCNLQFI